MFTRMIPKGGDHPVDRSPGDRCRLLLHAHKATLPVCSNHKTTPR